MRDYWLSKDLLQAAGFHAVFTVHHIDCQHNNSQGGNAMRDYWLTKDLLQAAGIGFILLSLAGIGLALWLPKRWWGKALAVLAVSALISIPIYKASRETQQQQVVVDDYKERFAKAQALFEERCKTAGEKIYKTVENVDGVLLINPRPQAIQGRDEADPNWEGAGLPGESTGNQYIMNFLFYEVPGDAQTIRSLSPGGTIATNQLWFSHTGNDLAISIIGTADKMTLQNWYLGNPYHVEQIKVSDGKVLLGTQVEALVQAMASFTPPAMGQTALSASQQTALTPVLAANWH